MKKYFLLLFIFLSGCHIPGSNNSSFQIGVVTDVQYCDCEPNEIRFFNNSIKKLDDCIDYFNSQNLSFVLNLGDVIDRDFKSFDAILPHFKNSDSPVYFVLGNHEYNIEPELRTSVLNKMNLKSSYYSFSKNNWLFVILNGDDLSFRAPQDSVQQAERDSLYAKLIRTGRCNTGKANGGISSKQFNWLKDQLESATQKNQNVVVMSHFPIYPVACHSLFNDEELTDMLTKYKCVKAYFCGHNHPGGYGEKYGVHFINFRAMVDTKDSTAYSIVTFTQDSMFVEGHGREPSRRLKIK